jgi:hypothetical protein
MTTDKPRYPQCRCARFGQSRFEPVQRTALDGKVWWVMYDYAKGEYDYSRFKKRRQALVHLAIEFRYNRLPYDPDPGFGEKWIHERTDQDVAWLVDHKKLKENKDETD